VDDLLPFFSDVVYLLYFFFERILFVGVFCHSHNCIVVVDNLNCVDVAHLILFCISLRGWWGGVAPSPFQLHRLQEFQGPLVEHLRSA
jgi:hypothetical protein